MATVKEEEKFLWLEINNNKIDYYTNSIVCTEKEFLKTFIDGFGYYPGDQDFVKFKITNLGKFEVEAEYLLKKK